MPEFSSFLFTDCLFFYSFFYFFRKESMSIINPITAMTSITFSYSVIDGLLHHKNSEASRHISLSVHIFICSENTKNTKKLQQPTDFFLRKVSVGNFNNKVFFISRFRFIRGSIKVCTFHNLTEGKVLRIRIF